MAEIKKVGILGGGMMGADIALSCALAGYDVLLKEINMDLAKAGVERAAKSASIWSEKKRLKADADQQKDAIARITPTDVFDGFEDVDIVIEAIFEDLKIKGENFNGLSAVCKPDCIIASNTSSIPITKLSATFEDSSRKAYFLGLHFFSPAAIMPLVEVISHEETVSEVVETAYAFCKSIGKAPIKVADCAGFVVNRILGAINLEALRLLEEGIATPSDIDQACKMGLGHPVGPFALMDQISNELNLKIFKIFQEEYGDRFRPRPVIVRKVEAGHFGRKTGMGWFDYSKK